MQGIDCMAWWEARDAAMLAAALATLPSGVPQLMPRQRAEAGGWDCQALGCFQAAFERNWAPDQAVVGVSNQHSPVWAQAEAPRL